MTDEIRRQLSENLEKYENNAALNKLTPSRRYSTRDDSSINLSSSRKSSRRGSGKKGVRRYNDSNILTSPVKLNRYASSEEDAYDISRHSSAVNVPLRDSPKERMRQGTPKLLSGKNSQRDATVTAFRSRSLSLREAKTVLADDEFDDDDDDRANDTLLSDLPSDIVSPEKHGFQKEESSSDKLSKKSIYPVLSPPKSSSHNPLFSPEQALPTDDSSKPTLLKPLSQSTSTKPLALLLSPQILKQPVLIHEDVIEDVRSPPRRIVPESRVSRKFESSEEEEPVPELTVALPPEDIAHKPEISTKRPLPEETPSPVKKAKKNIYPTIKRGPTQSETSAQNSDTAAPSSIIASSPKRSGTQKTLYPILSKPITLTTSPEREASNHVGGFIKVGSAAVEKMIIGDMETTKLYPKTSTHMPGSTVEDVEVTRAIQSRSSTKNVVSENGPAPSAIIQPSVAQRHEPGPAAVKFGTAKVSQPQQAPVEQMTQPDPETQADQLGDSDHWTKRQWVKFIKCFKQIEKGRDFSIFTPDVLAYLRCDADELLLKIGFYREYRDNIQNGEI